VNEKSLDSVHRMSCHVSVPMRTSISVLDMGTLALGKPGGGNLGFALDSRVELDIRTSDESSITFSSQSVDPYSREHELLLTHALATWHDAVRDHGSYSIILQRAAPTHVGVGSSAALQCALMTALNWMHRLPLSERILRNVLASHYSEVVDSILSLGFTTGLSAFMNLYGGFAVLSPTTDLMFHTRVPQWNYVFAVPPHALRSGHDSEVRTVLEDGRTFDRDEAAHKADIIWNQLVPAVKAGHLRSVGLAVRRLQDAGSKRAEILFYGTALYNIIDTIRANGVECVFMSANGPGIVLISEMECLRILETAEKCGLQVLMQGVLDNSGVRLSTI
jgi:beta-RFAP synthase